MANGKVVSARLYVGTSGWTYDDWSGVFYPEGVKAADRLAFYAGQFKSVELNASFYRGVSQAMIDAWNRRLPADFHMAAKGPRTVTHFNKLRDCRDLVAAFCDRMREVRTLRVVLWQLPPSLAKDVPRLEAFLGDLPETARHAVEFRHASWWDDEVAKVLKRHKTAMVSLSHPGLPDTIHTTADFLYVRFHGLSKQLCRYSYSRDELAAWADRLRPHLSGRTLYAFFNNDYQARAPRNAAMLRELLGEKS